VTEEREPRGVHNPRVVDLIAKDAERDEVVLTMVEKRPWGSDPEQLRELEAKFNAYLAYVQGGHLARQYPQYEGLLVCIHLDCAEAPRCDVEKMLRAMMNFAEGEGIRMMVRVIQPEGG
jgi:hypothetical protein